MTDRKVAVVLGGTVPHCELIRQLKIRGYYTILVDYLPNTPAKAVADEHVQESTLDKEAVLAVARERNASLVISGCVDQANVVACYVMEQLGLPVPYSYENALRFSNKGSMKQGMAEHGIPTSRYLYVKSTADLRLEGMRFPVMVKPADSNSANGVKKAENEEDMLRSLAAALEISRNGCAVVEEHVSGREISAYCFVKDHRAKLLMTAERISTTDGSDRVIKCYASIAPAKISPAAERRAEEIATEIAAAFDLDNTPLFFQGIVNGDEIDVIEFAPRVGGGSCFMTIRENTGFDILSATIDSWLGKPVSLDSWHEPTRMMAVNTVYGEDGVFDRIAGGESLKRDGVIEELFQIRSKGERLDNRRASSSRVCFFITGAEKEEELLEKSKKAYETLSVLDDTGRNLIRRDMSLFALWDPPRPCYAGAEKELRNAAPSIQS